MVIFVHLPTRVQTTETLKVTYFDTKTNTDKFEITIAKVGHDKLNHKTVSEVFNKLPDCR